MTVLANPLSRYHHTPLHVSHVLTINMRITLRTNQAHLGLRRNDQQPRYTKLASSPSFTPLGQSTLARFGSDATYAAPALT